MDERISIEKLMMNTALGFAERSTCCRIHAGAVITVDNRIVSTGYNGNAPRQEHCFEHFHKVWFYNWQRTYEEFDDFIQSKAFKDMHRDWAIAHELHGEMNAIIYAARKGFSIEGGKIYTTYSPCIFCTKAIIHAGLHSVYYHTLYDRPEGKESLEILQENQITVSQIT